MASKSLIVLIVLWQHHERNCVRNYCKSKDFSLQSPAMKKTILVCMLVALCCGGATRIFAAEDPGDRFLEAYFLIQEGDAAERQSDWSKADAKYRGAREILDQIKSASPDWNPHIIEFRTKYIDEHLADLQPKLVAPTPSAPQQPETPASATPQPASPAPVIAAPPQPVTPAPVAAAPPVPAPAPAAPPAPVAPPTPTAPSPVVAPAPAADTEQVKQLTAELQRAREQVQQLESARDDLNAKLQEQLSKVAPTQTNPQIEQLLKSNQELAAKLAAAQTQIAEARERAASVTVVAPAPAPAAAPAELAEMAHLRTELAQTRNELQQTKQDLQQTRAELGTTKQALEKSQADNVELRRSYDQVIAQLTDANRKLSSARASSGKDDEIIRQLRKENALLRIIAERKASASISPAESEENTNGPSIPELRGWRPYQRQTAAAKAEASKPQPPQQTPPSAMEESGRGKLVATLTAPKTTPEPTPVKTVAPVTPPAKTQTNAPAKPVAPEQKTPPPAPAPAPQVIKATPPVPAPSVHVPPPAPDERQLLNEARGALALKDFDTASAKYSAVLGMDPTNLVALSNLGAIRYQQSHLSEAEDYLRKAVAAAPNDSNTRSLLGVVFFRQGLTEDAFNELTRAVALDPHNAEAHNYLGIVLSQKGWAAAGEQEIRRAIELNPQYADAHFNLAIIYAKQRTPNVELAKYHYRKALDLGAPTDPDLEALLKKLSEKPPEPSDNKSSQP
jgi:Flp pilus assembly protein TadD/uncharacterized coiled-coil DUF342 family protein